MVRRVGAAWSCRVGVTGRLRGPADLGGPGDPTPEMPPRSIDFRLAEVGRNGHRRRQEARDELSTV